MKNEKISSIIEKGRDYLHSQIKNGICRSFHQLRRGPSDAWVSACIGSTLAELGEIHNDILSSLLRLRRDSGGWAYNQLAPADADTTLRVLQFFNKIGFSDHVIINSAISFIYQHQAVCGGICTYTTEEISKMGRPERVRYTLPHLDVSSLAVTVLPEDKRKKEILQYVLSKTRNTLQSYWWRTNYYIAYEVGKMCEEQSDDSISMGLKFLLYAKLNKQISDDEIKTLCQLQYNDGSFPPSSQLQLPRPVIPFSISSVDKIELVEDKNRVFSTSAALVAIQRQHNIR